MKTIALISTVGGAGRTTLTSALAGLLAARKHTVMAVECDPRNVLALYFGLNEPAEAGLVSYLGSAGLPAGAQAALMSDDQVLVLPWGRAADADEAGIDARLHAEPEWLRNFINRVDLPNQAVVLIDAPAWPSVEASQAIAAADLVLGILPPMPAACAMLDRFRGALALAGKPGVFIANGIMPARQLHRDLLAMLRATLGDAMLPYQIHADAGVPEALARGQNFCLSQPGSQAAHDMQGLAAWLARWAAEDRGA